MSWLNKLSWVLLPLILTGCGFQPLYGTHDDTKQNPLLAGVRVENVSANSKRMAQLLRVSLENKLNPDGVVPPNPKYRLVSSLSYGEAGIGTARTGLTSRYNVYLNSNYTLYRISDGRIITTGTLANVSGYNNITNEYFSTYVAGEDAVRRGINELAELYRQRLGSFLTVNPEGLPETAAAPSEPGDPLPAYVSPSGQAPSIFLPPDAPGFTPDKTSPYHENRFP